MKTLIIALLLLPSTVLAQSRTAAELMADIEARANGTHSIYAPKAPVYPVAPSYYPDTSKYNYNYFAKENKHLENQYLGELIKEKRGQSFDAIHSKPSTTCITIGAVTHCN